jgi:predicted ribosomally synthesized peptide with SipW-like signal peptide
MKKILFSLAVIGLIGGLVGGATWAYISDSAKAESISIASGNPDLKIYGYTFSTDYEDSFSANLEWDNVYPGWSDSFDVKFKNNSSSPVGLDVIPSLERKVGSDDKLRDVITLQFISENKETDALTLLEWENNQTVLEHLAYNTTGERWTLKFEFPETGENQNHLINSGPFSFDMVFDGIQAEAPITEITNETQEKTYGDNLNTAIAEADSGDTILIPDGNYNGFTLNKGLTIVGAGENVVIESINLSGEPRPTGIFITEGVSVNVENLRFENGGITLGEYPQGILTTYGKDTTVNVSNSEFIDLYMAIYFNPSVTGVIENNVFDGAGKTESHTAIGIDTATDVEVNNNNISNSNIGIEIFGGTVTHTGNTFNNVNTDIQ